MANNENLKPFTSEQNREEAKKNGKKGGKRSGEVRRERKTMKQMLVYLLAQEITNNKGEKATTLEAMLTAIIKKAIQGDVRAVQFVRDTIGEMPTQKHEVENTGLNIVVADKNHKKMLEEL